MSKHKNPCVYTGAVVYFENYSCILRCDLREIDGAVLVHSAHAPKFHPSEAEMAAVTHRLADPAGAGYVSRDKTVVMVPSECCIGPRR